MTTVTCAQISFSSFCHFRALLKNLKMFFFREASLWIQLYRCATLDCLCIEATPSWTKINVQYKYEIFNCKSSKRKRNGNTKRRMIGRLVMNRKVFVVALRDFSLICKIAFIDSGVRTSWFCQPSFPVVKSSYAYRLSVWRKGKSKTRLRNKVLTFSGWQLHHPARRRLQCHELCFAPNQSIQA